MDGELSSKINAAFAAEPMGSYRSQRIGASIVGKGCDAYIALTLRGFPQEPAPPNLKRIFREGHRIETAVISDLRKAGYFVEDTDPFSNTQFTWTSHNNHVVFKADGIITVDNGEAWLLEVKSMNDAMFTNFKRSGVRFSHKHYWVQCQVGMGLSDFHKCKLVAYNKDNSQYWDEDIEFDPIWYSYYVARIERILMGDAAKCATDAADWRCKDCPFRGTCWGTALKMEPKVEQDMRTCANSYPSNEAKWECSLGCKDKCMNYKKFEPTEKNNVIMGTAGTTTSMADENDKSSTTDQI